MLCIIVIYEQDLTALLHRDVFPDRHICPSNEVIGIKLFWKLQNILEMQDILVIAIAINLSITSILHNASSWLKEMIICFWLFVVGNFKY